MWLFMCVCVLLSGIFIGDAILILIGDAIMLHIINIMMSAPSLYMKDTSYTNCMHVQLSTKNPGALEIIKINSETHFSST